MLSGQPTTDRPPHGEVSHTRPFKYTCPTHICFEETGIVADFTKAFHQIWPFHACLSPRGLTFDIHAFVVHTSASLLENNKIRPILSICVHMFAFGTFTDENRHLGALVQRKP